MSSLDVMAITWPLQNILICCLHIYLFSLVKSSVYGWLLICLLPGACILLYNGNVPAIIHHCFFPWTSRTFMRSRAHSALLFLRMYQTYWVTPHISCVSLIEFFIYSLTTINFNFNDNSFHCGRFHATSRTNLYLLQWQWFGCGWNTQLSIV